MESIRVTPGHQHLPRSFDGLLAELGLGRIRTSGPVTLGGQRYHFKIQSYPTPIRRLTRALQNTGPWVRAPHLVEYENLLWLRAHGISAPRPAAAGVEHHWGFIRSHFLLVEMLEGAQDLFSLCRDGKLTEGQAEAVMTRLGEHVGRMHAQGFVHRDLFLRNVLVTGLVSHDPQVHLIDCRKGGLTRWRPAAYDLGCLEKWAGGLLPKSARVAFFRAYFRENPATDPGVVLASAERWRQKRVHYFRTKKRHRVDFLPSEEVELIAPAELELEGAR